MTTRVTALYVLGYLAMGRGDWDVASAKLTEALRLGEEMDELQRISPPLWGLAEMALLRADHSTAVSLCQRGFRLSATVSDAAYLFPFLLTGVRALLASGDLAAAQQWHTDVAELLVKRGIPGTLPAVDHGAGLLQLAAGDVSTARVTLARAAAAWQQRQRFWEHSWALLDQAHCDIAGRRRSLALALADTARQQAVSAGATVVIAAADRLVSGVTDSPAPNPWEPLTAREFEIATLVATGLTNREIGIRLFVSPKTVSAHLEHIFAKLGAKGRAEIGVWASSVTPR